MAESEEKNKVKKKTNTNPAEDIVYKNTIRYKCNNININRPKN